MNSVNESKKTGLISGFWSNVFSSLSLKHSDTDPFSKIFPISALSASERKALLEIAHLRKYTPGEHIFLQGDPGIGLYLIYSGSVEIAVETPDNEQIPIAEFGEGDFFGELALIDGEPRSASAIAKKEAIIYIIFKHDFDEFINRLPKVGLSVMTGITKVVVARMRQMNKDYALVVEKMNKLIPPEKD